MYQNSKKNLKCMHSCMHTAPPLLVLMLCEQLCISAPTGHHSPLGPTPKSKTLLTLAEVAELRVYTGWAWVCQILTPTICEWITKGERQRVSLAVLAVRHGVALQQQRYILFSHQPGVRPEDPQQAAYTQALYTLPPAAHVVPYGWKRVPRH